MLRKLLYAGLVLAFFGCKSSEELMYTVPYEETILDTLTVTAPAEIDYDELQEPSYKPSANRTYDILHTKLDISFDWNKQHVLSKAWIDITPLFYPVTEVILDAKHFLIHSVKNKNGQSLEYTYDDRQLTIRLSRTYERQDTFQLFIDYTARPEEADVSGGVAITSDKGLFFINPLGTDKTKPRQIWTQGETEYNSKWFPTFDKPNERCTQEMYITVADSLETLSNGTFVSSTLNNDGTKTDYWKMDKPHAPYLFMVSVGDFARVQDNWDGMPLEYMVEPAYEKDAQKIFNHTPEMLSFFSTLLDYKYPWSKYSQIVVKDYVSGAMENTSASIFGDFVQKNTRELIDNHNDRIVAHEMFHHWFGDLVTCESWANLTLNEGFANYSEYLWFEHKYGKDEADHHRDEEMNTYFYVVAQEAPHDLIHYHYETDEDMFDVHSYNKGGLVLHMLRNYIGDEAFFTALSKYLHDNEYTTVEVAQLRMAFEAVTGQDLNWFFNQWYLDKGHPVVEYSTSYDKNTKELKIVTTQVQDEASNRAVFKILTDIALIDKTGTTTYHKAWIKHRKDTIQLKNIDHEPSVVILDGKDYNLMEALTEFTPLQLKLMAQYAEQWKHKMYAVNQLLDAKGLKDIVPNLLKETHYSLRLKGVEFASTESEILLLEEMILNDSHSKVRAAALQKYASEYSAKAVTLSKQILAENTAAYPVIKAAFNVLHDYENATALAYAKKYASDSSTEIVPLLSSLLAETGDVQYLPYIERNLNKVSVYQVFNMYDAYGVLLEKLDAMKMFEAAKQLKETATSHSNIYSRYMAKSTIERVKNTLQEKYNVNPNDALKNSVQTLEQMVEEIIAGETNKELINRYRAN